MKSIFGYLIAGIGLIGLALSSSAGQKMVPQLAGIERSFILYPSLVILAIGIMIMIMNAKGGSGKARQIEKEVPIYKGKKIIGYRVE
jgi:hypothetical protein